MERPQTAAVRAAAQIGIRFLKLLVALVAVFITEREYVSLKAKGGTYSWG